jgi:cell shape-determining protein MreC
VLNQTQQEKDQRIQLLNVSRDHHIINQESFEKQLGKLSTNWRDIKIPNENQSILESKIGLLEEELKKISIDLQNQQQIVSQLEGGINSNKEMLKDIEDEILLKKKRNAENWGNLDLNEKQFSIDEEFKALKLEENDMNSLFNLTKEKINEYEKFKQVIQSNLSDQIDIAFEPSILKLIQNDTAKTIIEWTNKRKDIQKSKSDQHSKIDIAHTTFKQAVSKSTWDIDLKTQVQKTLEMMPLREYSYLIETINAMNAFAVTSLSQLSKDKEKAEEAQSYWTTRASMKVISIIDHLKMMVKKMVIENENGYKFPLVKLKQEDLPDKPEDVSFVLQEHFSKSIEHITKIFDKIEAKNPELDEEIYKLMSDEQIVFEALRHRYPTLLVYNLQTNNAFRYERPKEEYYSSWETINQGSETETSGSGGQVLSARMVIMMMLLSLKNHSQKWTTLICDNPFGQAASEHVLDPIFAASELLRFQLIVFTPPELVKTGISQRFPV